MTHEQHAKLVRSLHQFIPKNALFRLYVPISARKLVNGKNSVVTGEISVMYRWPVNHFSLFSQCQVVSYRNGFVMRYQKAMIGSAKGCPAAHACRSTGAVEIDGGITPELMVRSIHRPVAFMTTPT
jgi:hypothetical protein